MQEEKYINLSSQIKQIDCIIKSEIEGEINKRYKELMGQYFTPGNVIDMMLEILEPRPSDIVVDPSAGCGNILLHTHKFFVSHYGSDGKNVNGLELDEKLITICDQFHKDLKLKSKVLQCNTLQIEEFDNSVDVIIGNPPFGKKVNIAGIANLNCSIMNYSSQTYQKSTERIEILFLKKCVKMLKEGGKMGIILLDGVLGNNESEEIRKWLINQGRIMAVIDLPKETFLPYTSVKTSVVVFQKIKQCDRNYRIFMAIADSCGHDKRGNRINDDDVSHISEEYKKWCKRI